ncbi:hypothetical protein BH20ACI3_BH20ACI3_38140 [soil metagenome]
MWLRRSLVRAGQARRGQEVIPTLAVQPTHKNDPRNDTNQHEILFLLARDPSWIVSVFVDRVLTL